MNRIKFLRSETSRSNSINELTNYVQCVWPRYLRHRVETCSCCSRSTTRLSGNVLFRKRKQTRGQEKRGNVVRMKD